jgi:hypothetical protein
MQVSPRSSKERPVVLRMVNVKSVQNLRLTLDLSMTYNEINSSSSFTSL